MLSVFGLRSVMASSVVGEEESGEFASGAAMPDRHLEEEEEDVRDDVTGDVPSLSESGVVEGERRESADVLLVESDVSETLLSPRLFLLSRRLILEMRASDSSRSSPVDLRCSALALSTADLSRRLWDLRRRLGGARSPPS